MSKPREFIILDASIEQDFGHVKQIVRMCIEHISGRESQINGTSIRVREVSPELDAAYLKLEKAAKIVTSCCQVCAICASCELHDAFAALRKARGDE